MPKDQNGDQHTTDVIIIGAGPVGLFAVFELGLLGLKAHLIDILDRPGGQCAELYPEKPILDIPSRLKVTGQQLTDDLMDQIAPFEPVMHLHEMAAELVKTDQGKWRLTTDQKTVIEAPVIVIAGGGGSFTPKKPKIEGIEPYEGKSLFYSVRRISDFEGKHVAIAGGGDSALDWTMALAPVAASVALIHRRAEFRGVQDSVDKVMSMIDEGTVTLHTGAITGLNGSNGQLESLSFQRLDEETYEIPCDALLPFYGLTMKLGPIAEFGINLDKNRIPVDTEKFETSEPSIFCIGDMCSYPGKLKLILSGFHEAALMAHGCFHYVRPDEKLRFEHTTSSSSLQEKLS